jgi:hypothetical protein
MKHTCVFCLNDFTEKYNGLHCSRRCEKKDAGRKQDLESRTLQRDGLFVPIEGGLMRMAFGLAEDTA